MFLFILCLFQNMHTCFIEGVSALISHWIAALWNKYDRFWTEHKKYIVLNVISLHHLKADIMRIHLRKFFCVALIMVNLCSLCVHGQNDKSGITKNALSNLHINGFVQDKFGYMWIATAKGLCRYNGYEYLTFYHVTNDSLSLSSDFISGLLLDSKEDLWIATDKGLCRYNYELSNFERFNFDGHGNYCLNLLEYNREIIGYGTGISRINPSNYKLSLCESTEKNYFHTGIEHNNLLWMGGEDGIFCLNAKFEIIKQMNLPDDTKINCTYKHLDGCIWFGTNKGIVVVDPVRKELLETPLNSVLADQMKHLYITFITKISASQLCIGTENSGVYVYDFITRNLENIQETGLFPGVTSKHVTACYTDKQDNIWLGTFDRGYYLEIANKKEFNADNVLNSFMKGKFTTCIVEDNDENLWIGTRYSGLICYSRKTSSFVQYDFSNFLPFSVPSVVHSMHFSSKGKLWLNYGKKLLTCDIKGRIVSYKEIDVPDGIGTITEDNRGRIWVGSAQNGVRVYDPEDMHLITAVTPKRSYYNNVPRILKLSSGDMLISSYGENVYKVNPNTFEITPLSENKDILPYASRAIYLYEDNHHDIWIGTYGEGMAKYMAKNDWVEGFSLSEGLPSNDVLSIMEDDAGNMWVSTSFGLTRFEPGTRKFYNYFDYDGIQGNQFHEKCVLKTRDGELFFGGNHGLTFFYPSHIHLYSVMLPVILEDLKVFNESEQIGAKDGVLNKHISQTKEVVFNHRQNVFSIDYSGLDFGFSPKINYAYMMVNFDKDWNYVGNFRRATYSNLPPGEYIFEVKAQNRDGVWNNIPTKLLIRVKPSPWMTTGALCTYILFVLAVVYICIRIYVNMKINKVRLSMVEKERDREKEISLMKVRFFSNISHELRTPLTLIYGPVKLLMNSDISTSERQYLIAFLERNIKRILLLIDQLLDFKKLESDTLPLRVEKEDIVPLAAHIIDSFAYFAKAKNTELKLNCEYESLVVPIDVDKLNKILTNLISNAVKYTLNDGHVQISLSITEHPGKEYGITVRSSRYLVVSVEDDGIGMSEEDLAHLFERYQRFEDKIDGHGVGLNYVKRLVEKHKGGIIAKSGKGKGTVFSFVLPVDEAVYADEMEQNKVDIIYQENNDKLLKEPTASTESEVNEASEDAMKNEKTVLVVEDNAEVRMFISMLLKEYMVLTANNGLEGYQVAQEVIPDLIVSDVLMPEMDGYQFCHKVKNDPELSHIPFIILTAKTTESDLIEGYSQGADVYLNKPFNPELFQTVIRQAFINQERRRAIVLRNNGPEAGEVDMKTVLSPIDQRFMDKLYAYIDSNLSNCELNINMLGKELGFSRTSFYRKIKGLTGQTPNDFLRIYRLNKAAELILADEFSLNEIGDRVGFGTYSHFSTCFKKHFGVSPKDYMGT